MRSGISFPAGGTSFPAGGTSFPAGGTSLARHSCYIQQDGGASNLSNHEDRQP
ncbi:MAG: hypothetical protein IKZ46_03345 [Victivallales bacterium]|nr:hypothetical protein [Victivallales bacterium]